MKMKYQKVYKGSHEKELAFALKKNFDELSRKTYLEIERGNAETGYWMEKVENDFKGAFLRKRPKTDKFDLFIKLISPLRNNK